MTKTILVVDDSPNVRTLVREYLTAEGFRVVLANDGRAALFTARTEKPDLILLDIMMPEMTGYEFIRAYRKEHATPIILLTAKLDEPDKVLGLELGADDYVTKPFGMRELMARVKALLRRVRLTREELAAAGTTALGPDVQSERMIFGDLVIDLGRREVRLGEEVIHLKPKEFELLVFLARNRGIVLTRDLALERVWGWEYDGGSRTVDVHVRWLREKLEKEPSNPARIMTVRGVGYRFDG